MNKFIKIKANKSFGDKVQPFLIPVNRIIEVNIDVGSVDVENSCRIERYYLTEDDFDKLVEMLYVLEYTLK